MGLRLLTSRPAAIGLVVVAALAPAGSKGQSVVAFTHISVIDARDSTPRLDQTVVVRGNRIIASAAARMTAIPAAAHVSRAVGAAAASDSGQKSIEHLLAIPAPCTPAESIALAPRFAVQGALGRCSSEDLAPLYARFVRNGTWVTPTFAAQVE